MRVIKEVDSDAEEKRFPVEVSTKIKIIPTDRRKLGEMIDKLGQLMLDTRNPEFADAAHLLAFIEDPRVIKYHLQILEKYVPNEFGLFFTTNLSYLSVWALKKYDDDTVLEALKKLMNSPDDFMRSEVAKSLRDSPHPKALDLLLKMRNDKSSFVRLVVVTGLEKIKNDESNRLLREMLNDNDQWVREEAQKILDKREQK
jgi:3-methyladenine DNA glycosylase AlkD